MIRNRDNLFQIFFLAEEFRFDFLLEFPLCLISGLQLPQNSHNYFTALSAIELSTQNNPFTRCLC